jgi:hypothetical protein
MRLFLTLIPLLAAMPAAAETCKYVDKEGRITYSNVPIKGARKVTCFAPPATPSAAGAAAQKETAATTPKPRVEENTQRARDDDRRHILESELAAEQAQLDEARQALAEQEAIREGGERNYARVLERLKPYQDAVALHEKNVASLKQELANLR